MFRIGRVFQRLLALSRRGALEREMAEEIRLHVELETAELERSGVPPEEARRQALVAFGGVERTKEEVRDVRIVALVALTLLAVSALASLIPAIRATRVNPVAALQAE